MALKKGDFIELDYTGKLSESKEVFDTTSQDVAKKEGLNNPQATYGPVIIALGEGQILAGLDKALIGKELGKHTFHIADVDGFGKKSAKLLRLVPLKAFAKENIRPYAGLQVNIDNQNGIVRSVSGGRIIVDFNHPLASRDLEYDVDVKRIVTDKKEQVASFFKMFGMPVEKVEANEKSATVFTKTQLPLEFTNQLAQDIKRLTNLDAVSFESGKKPQATDSAQKKDPAQKKSSSTASTSAAADEPVKAKTAKDASQQPVQQPINKDQ